jgi:hypothetical protein
MVNLDQAQTVIGVAGCSGVFSLEELLSALGTPLENVSSRLPRSSLVVGRSQVLGKALKVANRLVSTNTYSHIG